MRQSVLVLQRSAMVNLRLLDCQLCWKNFRGAKLSTILNSRTLDTSWEPDPLKLCQVARDIKRTCSKIIPASRPSRKRTLELREQDDPASSDWYLSLLSNSLYGTVSMSRSMTPCWLCQRATWNLSNKKGQSNVPFLLLLIPAWQPAFRRSSTWRLQRCS